MPGRARPNKLETRFIMERAAAGGTVEEIMAAFPRLSRGSIEALRDGVLKLELEAKRPADAPSPSSNAPPAPSPPPVSPAYPHPPRFFDPDEEEEEEDDEDGFDHDGQDDDDGDGDEEEDEGEAFYRRMQRAKTRARAARALGRQPYDRAHRRRVRPRLYWPAPPSPPPPGFPPGFASYGYGVPLSSPGSGVSPSAPLTSPGSGGVDATAAMLGLVGQLVQTVVQVIDRRQPDPGDYVKQFLGVFEKGLDVGGSIAKTAAASAGGSDAGEGPAAMVRAVTDALQVLNRQSPVVVPAPPALAPQRPAAQMPAPPARAAAPGPPWDPVREVCSKIDYALTTNDDPRHVAEIARTRLPEDIVASLNAAPIERAVEWIERQADAIPAVTNPALENRKGWLTDFVRLLRGEDVEAPDDEGEDEPAAFLDAEAG